MMAGIRNAVIILVGLAAIGAFIGGGGLGDFIFYGISDRRYGDARRTTLLLSALALAFDYAFGGIERVLRSVTARHRPDPPHANIRRGPHTDYHD